MSLDKTQTNAFLSTKRDKKILQLGWSHDYRWKYISSSLFVAAVQNQRRMLFVITFAHLRRGGYFWQLMPVVQRMLKENILESIKLMILIQQTQFSGEYSNLKNMKCVKVLSQSSKLAHKRKYIMSWETYPSNFFFMKFLCNSTQILPT